MSFSVSLRAAPPGVRRPAAARPCAATADPRDRPVPPRGTRHDRRRAGADRRRIRHRARLLAAVPRPLPRAADRVALVERYRRGARLSRRATCCRSSTRTGCSASAGSRGAPVVGGSRDVRRRAARARRARASTSVCRCVRSTRGRRRRRGAHRRRPGPPLRRRRARPSTATRRCRCSPIRPTTSAACSRRSSRPRTRRCCTPTSGSCPAAVLARRGTTGSPTAPRRTATRRSPTTSTGSRPSTPTEHYCVTLNRTAEIDESRVIRRIAYEHPLYTFESLRGAGRAARAEPRAHRVRRRVARRRLPRGRARVRTARSGRVRGGAGEVGPVHRHGDARADDARRERLPLPRLLLRARPRRAARARPAAPPLRLEPAERRHAPRPRPHRRARVPRRARRRGRPDPAADEPPRPRLRLQPRLASTTAVRAASWRASSPR